jgi:hypothetical protein
MQKNIAFLFSLLFLTTLHAQNPNLLSGKYTPDNLKTVLIPVAQWIPFPKISDRTGWARADEAMMKAYLKQAESYIDYKWPSIPATK